MTERRQKAAPKPKAKVAPRGGRKKKPTVKADSSCCSATTAKGSPCRRRPVTGAELCPVHLGAKVGRPTKLDETVTSKIVAHLRAGAYVEVAAAASGISKATFFGWMERGDPEGTVPADAPFREFREQVETARATGEARNVALISNAAMKDWKAAAWMLERTYPDRYRPAARATQEASADDKPSEDPFAALDHHDDELAQRRRAR